MRPYTSNQYLATKYYLMTNLRMTDLPMLLIHLVELFLEKDAIPIINTNVLRILLLKEEKIQKFDALELLNLKKETFLGLIMPADIFNLIINLLNWLNKY